MVLVASDAQLSFPGRGEQTGEEFEIVICPTTLTQRLYLFNKIVCFPIWK